MMYSFTVTTADSGLRPLGKLLICLVFTACFLATDVSHSFAGHSGDINSTHDGGGTWGSILRLAVQVQGSTVSFTVSKKKGRFNTDNTVIIQSGERNGAAVVSGRIHPRDKSVTLSVTLDNTFQLPQSFYARITNSYGYAWVGPVQISGLNYHPLSNSEAPGQPVIDGRPDKAEINIPIHIAVKAGVSRDRKLVRIQCTAEDSDRFIHAPYISAPVPSGTTLRVPFTFYSAGKKTIACSTRNRCGSSIRTERRIKVKPHNTAPFSPEITCDVARSVVNIPVNISVDPGADPNGDPVRVLCTAEDSDRTRDNPYISAWTQSGSPVTARFTFYSKGIKKVTCSTQDSKKALSLPDQENIRIRSANSPPTPPRISLRPSQAQINRPIYISVLPGGDPDGDPIRVHCKAENSDKTMRNPYKSRLNRSRIPVDAVFTFQSSGSKSITCTTSDNKGAASFPTKRTIQVGCDRPWQDCGRTATEINISVRSSENNRISVESDSCGSLCEPEREISFYEPYLPEYELDQIDNVFEEEALYMLRGAVVYSNGRPVQGATVYILSPESGRRYSTTTDSYGRYALEIDQGGHYYRLQATKNGFQSRNRRIYTDDMDVTLRIMGDSFQDEEYRRPYNDSSTFDLP